MQIKFTANELGKPPLYGPIISKTVQKVADCELVFEEGPLIGHKLQGFVIWKRIQATKTKKVGTISVSGPNWQFKGLDGMETCGLLRQADDDTYGYGRLQDPLRAMILDAYAEWSKPKRSRARKLLSKVIAV